MAHAQSRLDSYRAKNDSVALTEQQTQVIRGRIAELKHLIDLNKGPSKQLDAIE